jgi:hypothetical protein
MSQYNFYITYRPGRENAAADTLSRKANELKTQKEKKYVYRILKIFRLVNDFNPSLAVLDKGVELPTDSGFALIEDLLKANRESNTLEEYRERVRNRENG